MKIAQLLFFAAFFTLFFLNPSKILACGGSSDASCQGQSVNSPCGTNLKCVRRRNQETLTSGIICACVAGTVPNPTQAPQAGWYAPDGSVCNRTNYHAYFTLPSCAGQAGYITEGIVPQSNCSTN